MLLADAEDVFSLELPLSNQKAEQVALSITV